jgi:hypothetical protein
MESTKNQPLEQFRADPGAAKRIVERLCPDENLRLECLTQFGESIRTAHDISASSWGVTLHDSEVRLNVGSVEALALSKDMLAITVRRPDNVDDWDQILQQPGVKQKWGGEAFRNMPFSYGLEVDLDHLLTLLPDLNPLHLAHVELAGASVRTTTNYHKTHSPGVMEYLREVVDEGLPNPNYSPDDAVKPDVFRRYWKISPGAGAKHWQHFRDQGLIAIGWDDQIDLRTLDTGTKEGFAKSLTAHPKKHPHDTPHATSQLWTFLKELSVGDLVCAYGNKEVLGWGTITGKYHFEPLLDMAHQRTVEWHSVVPMNTEKLSSALAKKLMQHKTLFELTKTEFEEFAGKQETMVVSNAIHPTPPSEELAPSHHFSRGFRPWDCTSPLK